MKPLNHHVMVAMCLASTVPECSARLEEDGKEKAEQPSAQHPCCQEGMNRLSVDYTDGKVFWRGWCPALKLGIFCRTAVGRLIYCREASN